MEGYFYYDYTLPNGLTLVAEQIPGVRSAAFHFLVKAGATTDPQGEEGSAGVIEGLAYRGAGERNARELSDALDGLGVQRTGGAELEVTTYGGALLSDHLFEALALYADILRRPHLPEDQFEAERDLALQRLERVEDNPTEKLFLNLRAAYFPGPHGRSAYGTQAGLQALTPQSARTDHQRRYRPGNVTLAVAGNFNWPQLQEAVQTLFGDWQGEGVALPTPSTEGRLRYRHLAQETAQEQIGIAYPAIPLGHPHYYDARMAMEVLSGGMAARLFSEVREKRGLCYSVRADLRVVRQGGYIIAYAGTTPERCQETLDVLLAELRRLEEGVTDDEVGRAEVGVLSSLVMQSESSRPRARAVVTDQYLLGRVRTLDDIRAGIRAVTPDSIYQYLQQYPARDFTVVTLGPTELEVRE